MRPLLLLLALLLPAAADAVPWRRAESPAFVIYARGPEAELRRRVQQLQQFDALVQLLTRIKPPADRPRLTVYFASGADLPTFGITDPNVDGFYRATAGNTLAVLAADRARNSFGNGVLAVLFHEYVHHFMFQNSIGSPPAWYVEGFAEYLMTATFKSGQIEFGDVDRGRAYQLLNEPWLPMQKVLALRGKDLRRGDGSAFYAESWLAAHYLSRDPVRVEKLRAYLKAVAAGAKPDDAFRTAFAIDYPAFDAELRAYLQRGRLTMTVIKGLPSVAEAAVTVTTLPPSADDLLMPAAEIESLPFKLATNEDAKETAARLKLLPLVRTAAARFPGDPLASRVLAAAEIKLGDRAAGTALAERLLADAPADPDLLYLRGATLLADAPRDADPEAARRRARLLLARAAKARPDDYRIMAAHARTYDIADFPDKEMPVLLRAADLAPQVSSIQMTAAVMLARKGDRAAAKERLTPIANNPHGGRTADLAAALIADIDRGETPAAVPGAAND